MGLSAKQKNNASKGERKCTDGGGFQRRPLY